MALIDKIRVLDEIREVIQVPIKLIHVIRNPFDNIATMMLRTVESRNAVREGGLKVRARSLNFIIIWLVFVGDITRALID